MPRLEGRKKNYIHGLGHTTKISTVPIYGIENLYTSASMTSEPMCLNRENRSKVTKFENFLARDQIVYENGIYLYKRPHDQEGRHAHII